MNWINIHTDTLRTEDFLGSEPTERATWLSLLAWCCAQENGGVIIDCKGWKDRMWQQLCGVTKSEVETKSFLFGFEGDNLVVNYYPDDAETKVKTLRENGRKGGRPKKRVPQVVDNKEEKPQGSALVNQMDTICLNEKERKERKGKVKKGKEKKDNKEPVAALPFLSDEFAEAWADWQTYLKQKRKTPTKLTTTKQINQLKKLNEKDAIETINRSIQNGWQGLFPSNEKHSKLSGRANSGSARGDAGAGEGISVPIL